MTLSLLHVSDLHLTTDFFRPATVLTTPHDPENFFALSNYWRASQIDYLFVTGDIATDGQLKSFENGRDFLLGQFQDSAGRTFGLGMTTFDRIFLVPGNHDRYLRDLFPVALQIKNFERVFGGLFSNPGRPRAARWIVSGSLKVRVIAFDSMGDAGATTARGKVHEDDLGWLRTLYDSDKLANLQCDLRVALFHHHIALPSNKRFKKLSRLRNREDVLEDLLRADVDLVVFGHEHYHYVGARTYRDLIGDSRRCRSLEKNGYNLDKKLVTCMCGTTTQQGADRKLAWHVEVDKSKAFDYQLTFTLLEVDGSSQSLAPVAGGKEVLVLRRQSCRKAIGLGF